MKEQVVTVQGYRFSEHRDGKEVGHAYVYIMRNDLHDVPFAFLEDLQVDEQYQQRGIGTMLHDQFVQKAQKYHCYKCIATSRNDGTRTEVHAWYKRLGYKDHGTEFRIDL